MMKFTALSLFERFQLIETAVSLLAMAAHDAGA